MYWSDVSRSSLGDLKLIFASWNNLGGKLIHEVSSSDWCEDLLDCRKHLRQLNQIIGAAGLLGCCCWSWRSHFLSIKWSMCECVFLFLLLKQWSNDWLIVLEVFVYSICFVVFCYRILFNDSAPMIVPCFFFRESLFWFHFESNDLFQQIKLFLCLLVLLLFLLDW